jgi:hypothetical protein
MKKMLSFVACLVFASLTYAQEPTVTPPANVIMQDTTPKAIAIKPPSVKYLCAHCNYMSEKPGKCPNHTFKLVEAFHYYCPNADTTVANNPGKCPKCNAEVVKMEFKKEKDPDADSSK